MDGQRRGPITAGATRAGFAEVELRCPGESSDDRLSTALWRIRDALEAAEGGPLLIHGTGAGFVSVTAADGAAARRLLVDTCDAIAQHPAPVFAAADGPLLGAGFEVALACDMRFARPGARVGFPAAADGLLPCGGIQRLAASGGISLATRLALLAETPTCGEDPALDCVFTVTADPHTSAGAALERACAGAPLAIEALKASLRAAQDLSLAGGLAVEADLACLLLPTADRAEGIDAQLARRPPRFTGR